MLTLIHGDDIVKSRKYFTDLKSKFPDATSMDGGDIDLTSLAQILEGGSFFSTDKAIFIENFILKKKNTTEYKYILQYLLNSSLEAKITIWESKELERKTLSDFKEAQIKLFKLPQSLFIFLDAIKPNGGEKLLQLFHDSLSTSDSEAVFYMLIRHFRLFIALSSNSSDISEIKRMQPWQSQKITHQAKAFNRLRLIELYNDLYQIESGYKTGSLSGDLICAIDIFLLGI